MMPGLAVIPQGDFRKKEGSFGNLFEFVSNLGKTWDVS